MAKRRREEILRDLILTHEPRIAAALPEATQRALLAMSARALRGQLERASTAQAPDATIVIVTENGLADLTLCLESITCHTADVNYDVVIIDNASTDGTAQFLRDLKGVKSRAIAVFNGHSHGTAAARNQGLTMARGKVVVLLAQDAVVSPGWLSRLTGHLAEPSVGVLGPVTNRASNRAQIPATYRTFGEFVTYSSHQQAPDLADVPLLNHFCLAMRRDVFEQIGTLDELFTIGVFQEEDYARRIRGAGLRVVCASDVFVHHSGRSVIGHLTWAGIAGERFQKDLWAFEAKWSDFWSAYGHASPGEYDRQRLLRTLLLDAIPPKCLVAFVSKGDERLIGLVKHGQHFPGLKDGTYAGHHPADSAQAIVLLEAAVARGVQFLVIPASTSWWLTYYDDWRLHLEARYRAIVREPDLCHVFDLRSPAAS